MIRVLVVGSTYRRGVYLLLGGVIALPYALLTVVFVSMLTSEDVPKPATWLLILVSALIAVTPAFLPGTRAVEIVAARGLLGVDLPDPTGRADRETTLRGALWFGLHLAFGALVGLALFSALPMALVFVFQWFAGGSISRTGLPFPGWHPAGLTAIGIVLLVLLGYAVAGLGALAAQLAPTLLGPSPAERIAALEDRAGRLVERTRLARELHDSVGHALTVTTLQAAAAQRALHDPEFVRQALVAIEETGRAAMDDLDHVLGLLRAAERADRPAPQRTLADVDRVVADVSGAGLRVALTREGPLATVPAALSREGYRIVQEALTNAVRHAGAVPVTVHIAVAERSLRIEVANPVTRDGPDDPSGRGLAGMRERVDVLGGRMTAGRADGRFTVAVRLPTGGS
ncbi:histidine kinase [Asanoa ishikariensis]|uniref:histidine kinase n=1 Tax=Asanoa ishikariensis TaxID=137265 RepID=A0A1H3LKC9_9ACTN|nr:histidine kinase [Asanoa ishikariensis]GIF65542.1 histidine kinase [Asanoa ishikariensis]SDY64902.1 Signal transduction histidine kinase [Asanoa ishikariensis]